MTSGLRWPSSRMLRPVFIGLTGLLACLAALGIVLPLTARDTVLDRHFLPGVVERTNTVERFYDEVLVDPDATRVAEDLTAGFPAQHRAIVRAGVGVNVRLVLPPETLRQMVVRLSDAITRWLRGDTDELRLRVDLGPVVSDIGGAVAAYVSGVLGSMPPVQTNDLARFTRQVDLFVADLEAGRRAPAPPQFDLTGTSVARVQEAVLSALPPDLRPSVIGQVKTALAGGDLDDALAAVSEAAVAGRVRAAAADLDSLVNDSGSSVWDVTPFVHRAADTHGGRAVASARWWLGTPRLVVLWVSIVLLPIALAVLGLAFGGSLRRRIVRVAVGLGCAAAVGVLSGVLLWWWLGALEDGVRQRSWPRSVQNLLADNAGAVRHSLLLTWLANLGLVVLAVVVISAFVLGVQALRQRGVFRLRDVHAWMPERRMGLLVTAIAVAAFAGLTVVVVQLPATSRERCNGYSYLCNRRYNQVVSLATHNAMANAQDKFYFPLQDPDIATQLNAGARALQLDSYEWETPGKVAARVRDPADTVPTPWATALVRLAATANPPRPGTWLCHSVCRAGATPFVPELRALRTWMRANPDEVVTIILQDETPATVSVAAFREAGLVPYMARPPTDPSAPWPTLGEMIASGHRLVAFTENAHNAAPWLQNFYSYGEETPYSFRSVSALAATSSCVAYRGGTGHQLFLLNHFVTVASGSRQASAEANTSGFLMDRVERCARIRGRTPTVIAVDFATLGRAQHVVDELNRKGPDGT